MEPGQSAEPEERRFGATRKIAAGATGGGRNRGNSGNSSAGAGRHRFWGNPETGRRRYRRNAVRGNPETINRHRRRMWISSRIEVPSPAKPEDAGGRET